MNRMFVAGVVMHDGESAVAFGHGLYAVPIRVLGVLY